jgi:hypothetical protein
MSSTLTFTLHDTIDVDVVVVIFDHCAMVGGSQVSTGGQHTVARVTGDWCSLAL